MNTEINQNHESGQGGNWIAFLFGAAFNLLANVDLMFLWDYALQAIVGGVICFAFKVIADIFSPLWEKHKERVKDFTKMKKIRGFKIRKKNRHDQE